MDSPPDISVTELRQRLEAGQKPLILDVREPWEVAIARIPGSLHIPLNEIPLRLKELDADSDIIVLCKAGGRSRRVADYLAGQGFGRVANLAGGIDAWSSDVEPTLPRY